MIGDMLGGQKWCLGATGVWQVETRDVPKHLTTHRTVLCAPKISHSKMSAVLRLRNLFKYILKHRMQNSPDYKTFNGIRQHYCGGSSVFLKTPENSVPTQKTETGHLVFLCLSNSPFLSVYIYLDSTVREGLHYAIIPVHL